MDKEKIISDIRKYVEKELGIESSGHDWWHVYRVWNMSVKMCEKEGGNLFVVQLVALLHDIGDWKISDDQENIIKGIMEKYGVEDDSIRNICKAVSEISFKGKNSHVVPSSLEGKIVQDADRLDALGAVGIARTFSYGGYSNMSIYNPELKPDLDKTPEEFKKAKGSVVNHFYEKLLLLKDLMNTDTGKMLAKDRHEFLEMYLKEFFAEWDGKK
jgi:uncharacterized protein